ncbi:hypothetical protein RM780_12150 [Streptomyces sp. DSM 44917]|uniref:Peptidoglycan binding domain-containing protein n=1 Tax=Streptomyces boetiae TaxID=3075541 RepID=A0ABU2L890_9ACTN|nr:hypothetical protein [Streptomyces sp. DSM 44917]MDT0307710.1 hypothetical protein [Streptomyces sp. DSM 44917]
MGPTTGPATGEMPGGRGADSSPEAGWGSAPAPAPGRASLAGLAGGPRLADLPEDPAAATMDLGGPFPPAPPPELTGTGPMAALTDPFTTGALPRVAAAESAPDEGPDTGALPKATEATGPAVPPPGPRPPAVVGRHEAERAAEEAEKAEQAAPAEEEKRPAPAPKAAPRRSSRRLRLLAVCVVGVAVVAYGAGLFLSPEDVPKGTTVLGVDIGGLSSQDARSRLDTALERANNDPLTLILGDREVQLAPDVAGLSVDTEATVRASSGQDYNPVAVIGSLFGAERTEEAVFAVDREKLTVALRDVAGGEAGAAGPVDGTVVFESGQAIGRLGEPGTAVDIEAAADAVERAFRDRAATGRNPAVELPMTTQEPLIGADEVERALMEFGEPAMSGFLWLVAGNAEVPFSPDTLSRLLTMVPSESGTLQPVMDLEGLAAAYGGAFDGVVIDGGAGQVPMQPEHAAAAMIEALRETATVDGGVGRREAVVDSAVGP